MTIVTCGHHSGMGLCASCQREQDASYAAQDREDAKRREKAAKALEAIGDYHRARLVREGRL